MRKASLLAFVIGLFSFTLGCTGNLTTPCVPQCADKECGNDSCGGTCGTCGPGLACSIGGQCVSSFCGNGRLDPGESCDFAIPDGAAGACETACTDDGDSCTTEEFYGNPQDCDAECRHVAVSNGMCINDDGCCPAGCLASADSDCSMNCGDGIVQPEETCDDSTGNAEDACPSDPATDCPDDGDACTTPVVNGNVQACASVCNTEQIEACVDDDGCCPTDCGIDDDTDCEFVCGDGEVTGPENCDNAITDTADPGYCPAAEAECDDGDACTAETFSGDAADCSASCNRVDIVDPVNGDGCCPPGATPDNDDDCEAVCGDMVVEGAETCDNAITAGDVGACPQDVGDCDDSDACTMDEFAGVPAECSAVCNYTDVMMPTPDDGCCYFSGLVMNEINDCQTLCDDYCTAALTNCLGANALFSDDNASGDAMDECQTACAAFDFPVGPPSGVDAANDTSGDTLTCRIYHLGLADPNDDATQMTHCPHATLGSAVCIDAI